MCINSQILCHLFDLIIFTEINKNKCSAILKIKLDLRYRKKQVFYVINREFRTHDFNFFNLKIVNRFFTKVLFYNTWRFSKENGKKDNT